MTDIDILKRLADGWTLDAAGRNGLGGDLFKATRAVKRKGRRISVDQMSRLFRERLIEVDRESPVVEWKLTNAGRSAVEKSAAAKQQRKAMTYLTH